MKKPTAEQIKAEAAKLREIKPRVLRRSGFGEDHHEAIDAQLEVLENNLTDDDIYNRSEETEEFPEPDWAENQKDAALSARRWMDGDESESPAEAWKPLMDRAPAMTPQQIIDAKKGKNK